MKSKQLVIALIVGSSLGADMRTVKQAREAHSLSYLSSEQIGTDRLGSLLLQKNSSDARVMQIKVAPQMSQGLFSLAATLEGSSCGYHAVKNGILFSLALLEGPAKDTYLPLLKSDEYARVLFGKPQAPFRLFVMQQRFKRIASTIYHKQIEMALKHSVNQDNQVLLRCIHDLDVVDPTVAEQEFSYSADTAIVCSQLKQRMEKMIAQGSSHSEALKRLLGKLKEYFNHQKIQFTITFDGRCSTFTRPLGSIVEGSMNPWQGVVKKINDLHLYGRWATSAEIMDMVDYQRSEGLLQEHPRLLVAVGEYGAFANDKLSALYALLTETDDDLIGTVLVYLGSSEKLEKVVKKYTKTFAEEAQQLQQSQDYGHWISLVVSRIKGDKRYYVLDSLNSSGALSHHKIRELIDIFDGKKQLPGYQWTISQAQRATTSLSSLPSGKSFLSLRTKALLVGIGLAALACGGYLSYSSYLKI